MQTAFLALSLLLVLAALTGCGGYVLRGKVIEGSMTDIYAVAADDPRMDREGISEVMIVIYRDPQSLRRQRIADGRSAPDGSFAIPISEFGAGWMDEQWLIQVYRVGYQTRSSIVTLPSNPARQPLIVTMAPGQSTPLPADNSLRDDYERYR